ncbi:FxLYD domain-containing protein [Halorussus halophilus]|uniref:FxLYD domain-containing protein n=1 Tax=Halorussus halophilus TaxID=2650975 RepID=UPI00130129C8|nr:FxLYD domain-containing protein [Halorussus halophilus]
MNQRALAVGVALLAVAGVTAFFLGGFPSGSIADPTGTSPTTVPAGSDSGSGSESGGSNSGSSGGSSGGSGGDSGGSSSGSDSTDTGYFLTIDNIEKCGSTCRDVTATLKNTGDQRRENVHVTTKVYADDDKIWTGEESVGTLEAGGTHTSTKRVKVGYIGGAKIKNNDGYVTIVTIVESDSGTTKFSERRKVA